MLKKLINFYVKRIFLFLSISGRNSLTLPPLSNFISQLAGSSFELSAKWFRKHTRSRLCWYLTKNKLNENIKLMQYSYRIHLNAVHIHVLACKTENLKWRCIFVNVWNTLYNLYSLYKHSKTALFTCFSYLSKLWKSRLIFVIMCFSVPFLLYSAIALWNKKRIANEIFWQSVYQLILILLKTFQGHMSIIKPFKSKT